MWIFGVLADSNRQHINYLGFYCRLQNLSDESLTTGVSIKCSRMGCRDKPTMDSADTMSESSSITTNDHSIIKPVLEAPQPLKINKKKIMNQLLKSLPEINSSLVFTSVSDEVDANDDLKRELVFYATALKNAQKAYETIEESMQRPDDYYCEMLKSDSMMEKMKKSFEKQQLELDNREQKREQQRLKKFGKKIQKNREVEKQKERKTKLDNIKKFRKGNKIDQLMDTMDEDRHDSKSKNSKRTFQKPQGKRPQSKSGGKRLGKSRRK